MIIYCTDLSHLSQLLLSFGLLGHRLAQPWLVVLVEPVSRSTD